MDEEPDKEVERELAKRHLARLDQMEGYALEQFGSMGKWLMASLLAINSAGAIAILSKASSAPFDEAALVFFCLGIAAALLSGVTMQAAYNRFPEILRVRERYWVTVTKTGTRDEAKETVDKQEIARLSRWDFLPPVSGWASGLLWAAGAAQLAFSVI